MLAAHGLPFRASGIRFTVFVALYLSLLLPFGGIGCVLYAQSRDQQIRARVDSMLTERYFRTPYDTNYVVRPEGKLTLKVRMNQTGNSFHAKGTVNDIYSKADLKTSHKTTFSVAGNYRGIGLGLAINPSKWKGIYKDYEFNLNYYSSRISLDFSYQRATTLAGISYQGGSIKTTDDLKARNPNAPDVNINIGHIGIGGGYGYNWVLGKKWLLHFSMLPTFVIYNRNKFTVNGERKMAQHIRFNMIFNERAAVVYNFSPRYFAGVTLVMNNSIFDDDAVVVNQNKWRARASFGIRL